MFSEADAGSSSIYISHGNAQEGNSVLSSCHQQNARVFLGVFFSYAGQFVYVTSTALASCQDITCLFVAFLWSSRYSSLQLDNDQVGKSPRTRILGHH